MNKFQSKKENECLENNKKIKQKKELNILNNLFFCFACVYMLTYVFFINKLIKS